MSGQTEPEKDQQRSEILTAPVTPLYMRMAIPIIFGLLVNGLYNFVDAIFIARAVGADGIGGVSAAFPIHMVMISISAMMGSGMASVISRRLGAERDEEASRIFSASLLLSASVGVVLSILVVSFCDPIFGLLGLPAAIHGYAVEYMLPIAMFSGISFSYGILDESIRAQGRTVEVFKMMLLSACLNIVLDAIFLFGFGWGVTGAAWATNISIFAALLYAVKTLYSDNNRVHFKAEYFRFQPEVHKEAVSLGIPVLMSYGGYALMLLVVNLAIVKVAPQEADLLISAHGILNRTLMLIFLPIIGMMIAFQTLAGFNYGAQIESRVREGLKVALWVSTGYSLLWTLVMVFIPQFLLMLFTDDAALLNRAVEISQVVFLLFVTAGLTHICPALFQAMGYAKHAAWLNALHTYVLLLPVLWLSIRTIGAEGLWWSFPILDGLTTVIITLFTLYFIKQLLPGGQPVAKSET